MLSVLSHHPNVVVLQTLSKAWGMAGLRLGLAFASPEVAALFAHVKYPYNVNGPTQREVMQRLATEAHDEHVAEVIRERQALSSALLSASCVVCVYPSDANFLLIKVRDADALYAHLVAKGIIVRNRHRVPGCKNCLRHWYTRRKRALAASHSVLLNGWKVYLNGETVILNRGDAFLLGEDAPLRRPQVRLCFLKKELSLTYCPAYKTI